MEYVDKLQSGLKYMVEAGQTGRKNLDGMLSPVNDAIGSVSDAADDLESLPFVGDAIGRKLQRITGAIDSAQGQIDKVMSTYSKAEAGVARVQDRVDTLKEQGSRAKGVVDKLAGNTDPKVTTVLPTAAIAPSVTPAPEASSAHAHLLIMQLLTGSTAPFYFGLDTAAFDQLRRSTAYRWAAQERLTRRPAQQAIGMGEEKLTIKGVIYPGFKGGLKQLERLRSFGQQLQPLMLTTGYGLVLGNWCLTNLEEEQSVFLQGGIPRKQSFNLEFVRYGDDMQNI